jgi:hypothetical protein
VFHTLTLGGALLLAAPPPPADDRLPEAIELLLDVTGVDPSPRLGSGRGRLGYEWLARRCGVKPTDGIARKDFRGPTDLFARLDRDGDGVIRQGDFDWSERAPYVQQMALVNRIVNRADRSGDGRLSAEEWHAAFERLAKGKDTLSAEELRSALFPSDGGFPLPGPLTMLRGYVAGELGSLNAGPEPGDPAPDFTLATPDGNRKVTLSDYRGEKPVVLVFGSFT